MPARRELIQQNAERKNVRAPIDVLSRRLLGRKVREFALACCKGRWNTHTSDKLGSHEHLLHRWYCSSAHWSHSVERRLLPWVLADVDVGDQLLELGPGPGITTYVLRRRTGQLTCVEIDERLAARLSARLRDTNVRVLRGDATYLALRTRPSRASSRAPCCITSRAPSSRIEFSVKRGGCFAPEACSSARTAISSPFFRMIHAFDTLVPVEPAALAGRLDAAGFRDTRIDIAERVFRFRAHAA